MTGQSSVFCLKPIIVRGSFFFSSIRADSSAMAWYKLFMSSRTSSDRSFTAPRFSSCCSDSRSTLARSSLISADTEDATDRYSLIWTNARIIAMFARIAISLCKRPDSIATPCSVNARGSFLLPPQLDVTICDFKLLNSLASRRNMKSEGNRSRFLCTAWFNDRVSTWYNFARSESNITFLPRIS